MTDIHWTGDQCCCGGCLKELGDLAAGVDFALDPSNPLTDPSTLDYDLPVWSAYRTAQHIARTGSTYADDQDDPGDIVEVTFRFRTAEILDDPNHAFEEVNQQHTREILAQFSDIANVEYREVTSQTGSANINFQYRDGSNGGGYWNGTNVVVSRVGWEPEMDFGTYNRRLMLHEIGHAMGLSHPGNYNGGGSSYATHADHWNDSQQFTTMSYWDESNTGGKFGSLSTLGLHDILALQIELGANMSTRTGDDTYGFNATAGDAYDFTSTRTNRNGGEVANTNMAFSIWDADGDDTLDFSGSSKGTELDLRAGSFSSTNGQTFNVSIAYNVTIENGVGSDNDDLIRGNEIANELFGGQGDDTLIGGALVATPIDDTRFFTGIALNQQANVFDQHLQVDDFNGFSQGHIDIDMMVVLTRMSVSTIPLVSYATSSDADSLLVEARANGMLRIEIDGVSIDTNIATISLIDGEAHRVGVTWDSDTGVLKVHLNGDLAWEGVHQQGAQIASGGTLIFGQDQDWVGSGFNIRETFQGVIGDIRVFDAPRSDADIAAEAFGQSTQTPVHHWLIQNDTHDSIPDAGAGGLIDLVAADLDNVSATLSSQWGSRSANFAFDGDANTSFHTRNGENEAISVFFENAISGERIELKNISSNGARLNGAVVTIYDAAGALIETFAPIANAGSRSTHQFDIPDTVEIGEIRVTHANQYLHFAEIKVLGQGDGSARNLDIVNDAQPIVVGDQGPVIPDSDTLHGGDGNDTLIGGFGDDILNGDDGNDRLFGGTDAPVDAIAADPENVTVTLSSQYQSYTGDRIIDGDVNSFAHTERSASEFISAQFETAISGELIEIRNRDSSGDRLNGAEVAIYDSDGALIKTFAPITGAAAGSAHRFTLPEGALIGEIKITHSNQFLHIAEIKVLTESESALRELALANGDQPIFLKGLNPLETDADTLNGGDGDDWLMGGLGDDALNGDNGDDMLFGGAGNDRLSGGDGADMISDGSGDDVVSGGAGADMIATLSGANIVEGGAAGDLITGGIGADTIDGGNGNDVLVGDISQAVFGNDVLTGGAGDDLLQGGRGADTFVFGLNDGADTIGRLDIDFDNIGNTQVVGADFQLGLDQLDLRAFNYATAQAALDQFEMIDGHATFNDQGTQIVLFEIDSADLSAQNILFL